MRQSPDVYVCSKPYQYFNIKNIGNVENASKEKNLIMVGAFYDAPHYVKQIREYDREWSEVLFVKDVSEKNHWLRWHKINNLFLENDASWKIFFIYLLGHIKSLYVYEEGIGSYQDNNKHGFEAIIRRVIGIGNHFGNSKYSKGIFLTKPWLYNHKFKTSKGRPFCSSFVDCIKRNEALFEKLVGCMPEMLDVRNKSILIYVTDWDINQEVLERLEKQGQNYDLCLLKPHPHIIQNEKIGNKSFLVLQGQVMMEMILYYLLKRNNHVTVWHHCSTSVVHFLDKIESELLPVNTMYKKLYMEYINA